MRRSLLLALAITQTACGNALATRVAKIKNTADAAAVLDSIVPKGTSRDTAIARLQARGFTCSTATWRNPQTRCAARAHTMFIRDEQIFVYLRDSAGAMQGMEVVREKYPVTPDDSLQQCAGDAGARGMGGGGGLVMSDHVISSHTYLIQDRRGQLTMAVIVRGPIGWLRTFGPTRRDIPPRPKLPVPNEGLNGISVHDIWFHYDSRTRMGWADTVPVQLGDNNAVLIERGDSVTKTPFSAKAVKLANDTLYSGCAAEPVTGVRTILERSPEIRAFINQ